MNVHFEEEKKGNHLALHILLMAIFCLDNPLTFCFLVNCIHFNVSFSSLIEITHISLQIHVLMVSFRILLAHSQSVHHVNRDITSWLVLIGRLHVHNVADQNQLWGQEVLQQKVA